MSAVKKMLSLFVSLCMLLSVFTVFAVTEAAAVTPLGCLVQTESQWKSYYYGTGNLYYTGCGIFSLVNAVGYLTGKRMSITSTAQWFHDIGGYNVTGGEGTYRTVVYPKVQAKYGSTYGFTVDCGSGNTGYWSTSASTVLKNHLAKGGVAVGHVPGHFIALVGYNSSTNKFHVYDSAPSSARGTLSGYGDAWLTQSQMATGKMDLDWFCLLSATSTEPEVVWETGEYTMLGAKHLRDVASDTYNTIVTVPAGEVMSVTKIVNKAYGYTQYGDYVGYIYLDEDVKRTGNLNTDRLAAFTCEDVRYMNSDYTASWEDVAGASGYRYKVIQLEGEPDPGNANESANATVLVDSTKYITQTLSTTVAASKMTNGKYLKIAVETVFPDGSMWNTMYVTPAGIPFKDIKITSWMYDPVLYCYETGLLTGVNSAEFCPDTEVTMAMLVTVIHRAAGKEEPTADAVMPYGNVAEDAYYYKALLWCVEQNIIRIDETPSFESSALASRETAVKCFYRLADRVRKNDKVIDVTTLDVFSDADTVSDDCRVAVTWAVTKGIITGNGGKLSPADTSTRVQLAAMLQRLDIFLSGVDAVYNPITKGDINNNGSIDTADYISLRAHLAEVSKISDPFEEAADYNGDKVISSGDYIMLKQMIMGK